MPHRESIVKKTNRLNMFVFHTGPKFMYTFRQIPFTLLEYKKSEDYKNFSSYLYRKIQHLHTFRAFLFLLTKDAWLKVIKVLTINLWLTFRKQRIITVKMFWRYRKKKRLFRYVKQRRYGSDDAYFIGT